MQVDESDKHVHGSFEKLNGIKIKSNFLTLLRLIISHNRRKFDVTMTPSSPIGVLFAPTNVPHCSHGGPKNRRKLVPNRPRRGTGSVRVTNRRRPCFAPSSRPVPRAANICAMRWPPRETVDRLATSFERIPNRNREREALPVAKFDYDSIRRDYTWSRILRIDRYERFTQTVRRDCFASNENLLSSRLVFKANMFGGDTF